MGESAIKSNNFTIKNTKSRHYRNFMAICGAFLLSYTAASIFAPVKSSSAEKQEFQASIANALSGVSVTAKDASINVDVGQPSPTGTVVKVESSLTAQTASSGGYQLYVSTDSNATGGNRLYIGGDTSAAYISPNHDSSGDDIAFGSEDTLSSNSWGFTINSDKYENGQFAAVPIMGNEALIKNTNVAGEDEIPIYFGVNVNTNVPSGTYTGSIIYTIIAEDIESDSYSTPSVSSEKGAIGSQLTITLPLRSSITSVSELGTVNATIGGVKCNDQNVTLNSASLSISCTAPVQATRGAKDVAVYIQQYNDTYIKQNGFTYITYMHEMSADICSSMKSSSTDTLKDIRGSYTDASTPANYGIIKALDGNCWMTDNLNLYGMEITSEYSDFSSNNTYTIPNTTTTSSSTDTVAKVFRATTSGYADQVYYNHTATAALTDGSANIQQDQSICPKNWQLPLNGDSSVDKSWSKYMGAYGITSTAGVMNATALGFTRYFGTWANFDGHGGQFGQGSEATFWSSTIQQGTNNGYCFVYYSSGGIYTQWGPYTRAYGRSIRCVSRD